MTRVEWLTLGFLILVGAWLRVAHLDLGMRYDEAYTVWRYASRSTALVLADYSLPNNHVFHTLLVHLTGRSIGGWDPWIVRLPALIAGIALIPATFATFRRFAGVTAGLLTAALVAGSSTFVDYSVNARGYTISALLGIVALALAWELRRGTEHPRRLVLGLGLVGAIGLWTVPVFAYVWGGVVLWIVTPSSSLPTRQRLIKAVSAGAVSLLGAAVLYLPVIVNEGPAVLLGNRFVQPTGTREFVAELPQFLRDVVSMWATNLPLVVLVAMVVGLIHILTRRRSTELCWLLVAMAASAAVLLGLHRAIPYPRNWLVFLPVVFGVAACGLAGDGRFPRPGQSRHGVWTAVGISVTAVWMSANVWTSSGSLSGQDDGLLHAEQIALELRDRIEPADVVLVTNPGTAPLRYYFFLHDLPEQALTNDQSSGREMYAVTIQDQSVAEVLQRRRLPAAAELELLAEYPTGSLWRVVTRQ